MIGELISTIMHADESVTGKVLGTQLDQGHRMRSGLSGHGPIGFAIIKHK